MSQLNMQSIVKAEAVQPSDWTFSVCRITDDRGLVVNLFFGPDRADAVADAINAAIAQVQSLEPSVRQEPQRASVRPTA